MYPRCDNVQEAAEVVQWMKFSPLGKRGFNGGNPDMPYCTMPMDQYVREANEQTLLILQLEQLIRSSTSRRLPPWTGSISCLLGRKI